MSSQVKRARMNDSNDAPMESSGSSSPSGVKPPVNNSLISKTPASVTVALHPLVILNVSDHFTRIRAQGSSLNGMFKHGCLLIVTQIFDHLYLHLIYW